jgi:parallel beta-helix repeat protein
VDSTVAAPILPVVISLVVPLLRAAETGACAAQTGGASVQTMSSWTVTGDQVVQNQTIKLNGTLQIQKGTLTLRNVSLEIDHATQTAGAASGGLVAINGGPGTGLVISHSSISTVTTTEGTVIANGSAAIDNSCFTNTVLWVGNAKAPTILSNEFVLGAAPSTNAIVTEFVSAADFENNNIRFVLGPETPPFGDMNGGINLMDTHDSAVLNNTIVGSSCGIGLVRSWNNHVAGNLWKGPAVLSLV